MGCPSNHSQQLHLFASRFGGYEEMSDFGVENVRSVNILKHHF